MNGRNHIKLNCLVCVLWCLIFNASAGQLNGDPAPGRSPGPPSSSATMANTIWTSSNNAIASSNDIISGVDFYDDDHHKTSDEILQVPQSKINRKVSASKPIRQSEKLVDKLSNEFVNHKPCKSLSVNEYLLMRRHSPEIVKVEKSSTTMQNSKTPSSSPSSLSIDVNHHTFDLDYGLVRNVIYTGNNCFGIFNEIPFCTIRSPQFKTIRILAGRSMRCSESIVFQECFTIVFAFEAMRSHFLFEEINSFNSKSPSFVSLFHLL